MENIRVLVLIMVYLIRVLRSLLMILTALIVITFSFSLALLWCSNPEAYKTCILNPKP